MIDRDTDTPKVPAEAAEEGGFLRRWSQRKHAIARGESPVEPAPAVAPPTPPAAEPPPLPDPTTLTLADDFSVFLGEKVPHALKRQAMQHLFSHPQFNEVDMLDVYMEDFNLVPDLKADEFALLKHAKEVLDPTPTLPEGTEDARVAEAPTAGEVVADIDEPPAADATDAVAAADEAPAPRADLTPGAGAG